MIIDEEQLLLWTSPAFKKEEKISDFTEDVIRKAINNHHQLAALKPIILPKGSVKNNTNVRRNSDIDVAIILENCIQTEFVNGANLSSANLVPYFGIAPIEFKNMVGEALHQEFGATNVDRSGNRVFRIRGSDKVIDADVVPCTRYHFIAPTFQRIGIALILDRPDGVVHFNYPEQHYINGKDKNLATKKRFKRLVRILKQIDHKMVELNFTTKSPSHLIECLAFQVPDEILNDNLSWRDLVKVACESIHPYLIAPSEPSGEARWKEVNGYKFLFGEHQRWTREDARRYIENVYVMVSQ